MEITAGSGMGLLLGMVLVVSCRQLPAETNAYPAAVSFYDNHYAAGRSHVMSEREVKRRKGAPADSETTTALKVSSSTDTALNASSSSKREELKHLRTPNMGEHQPPSITPSTVVQSDQNGSSTMSAVVQPLRYNVTASTVNFNSTPAPKKKGKPGLTYDEDDLPRDANGKPILTKENLVSAGPAFDYVVPIVIAMLAIPFVAVIGAFLYKKGRDFWDRRHYRRMDFLIDGMYNDS